MYRITRLENKLLAGAAIYLSKFTYKFSGNLERGVALCCIIRLLLSFVVFFDRNIVRTDTLRVPVEELNFSSKTDNADMPIRHVDENR